MKKIMTFIFSFLLLLISISVSAFSFKSSDFSGGDDAFHRDDCDSAAWGSEDCDHERSSNSAMRWSSGKMDSGRWGGGPFNTESRNWGGAPWNWGGSNSPWNSHPGNWNNRNLGDGRNSWNRSNRGYNNPYYYPYRRGPYNGQYGAPYNAGPGLAPNVPWTPGLAPKKTQ